MLKERIKQLSILSGNLLVIQVINNNLHLGPFFSGLFLDLLGVLFCAIHFVNMLVSLYVQSDFFIIVVFKL